MERKVVGGRYQVIRKLGGGGFCQVYLAEDIQMPDAPKCVIKELKQPEEAEKLATARRLFDREARILQKLGNHDQIPRLLAFFEESEEFYLVEDYVEGNTVSQELDRVRKWQEAEVIILLQDILSILEYVHQHQVVHRDIKPSNIIKRAVDGKFVLIDFGAVKQISSPGLEDRENTVLTIAIGTPGYIPIEQMAGQPNYSSDLFALGMTAIRALTGKQPRDLHKNSAEPIAWRQEVSASNPLANFLDRMVRPDFGERYPSATAAIAKLHEVAGLTNQELQRVRLDTTVTVTAPIGRRSLPSRWRFFQPLPMAVGAIAIAAGLGILELSMPTVRPLYYARLGNRLLAERKAAEAFAVFNNVIDRLQPDSVEAWKGRGNALIVLERYEGALAAYEKVLQLQPQEAKNWNNKGRALYQLGRQEEALDAHEKAIALDANNAQSWNGKGVASIGLGKFPEAIAAFDRARSIAPQDPTVWQSKAIALEYLNRKDEAISIYEEALAVYDETVRDNPEDLVAWVDRGSVFIKLQRLSEALDSLEKAIAIDSKFFPALSAKANVLSLLYLEIKSDDNARAKQAEALSAYQQALDINENDYQTWYNRGLLLAKGLIKNYPEAIASFEKAIEIRPRFAPAWLQKGEVSISLERYQEALEAFDEVIAIDAKNPFAWANRGLALEKLQRESEAIASYDRALELYPDFQPVKAARERLGEKLGR